MPEDRGSTGPLPVPRKGWGLPNVQYVGSEFARRLGLRVVVTRNSDEWLTDRKGVSEHASKVEYAVGHLRSGGSDFRARASRRPEPETCSCA